MIYVAFPLEVFGFEPTCGDDPVEFYGREVLHTAFCLVQPVAMEGGLLVAPFVVSSVLEHVVETESVVFVALGMTLIIKTQYVDLLEPMSQCQSPSWGTTRPTQARLEPVDVIQYFLVLGVLGVVV